MDAVEQWHVGCSAFWSMHDTTITKVSSARSPTGAMGQKYLASGVRLAMRIWEEEPQDEKETIQKETKAREYETVGYVIRGRAELELEGQLLKLEPGDCWVVPHGARHRYRILEPFT